MWFIVKLVSIFLSIDGINSQKDDNILGVGGTKDEGNCYISAGYKWCESQNRCVRPWITPCPDIYTTKMCPSSPNQLCRMMCPTINCKKDECAMRTGTCCDIKCVPFKLKIGSVCKSGGVETGLGINRINDCPKDSKCLPSNAISIGGEVPWVCQISIPLNTNDELKNCKSWYDGCNTCSVKNDKIVGCTMMYCIRKNKSKCLVYNGH